jgi:hypothetical protein
MFGEEFPGDFARWKIEAFKTILSSTDRIVPLSLFSWSPTSSASGTQTSKWKLLTAFRRSSSIV